MAATVTAGADTTVAVAMVAAVVVDMHVVAVMPAAAVVAMPAVAAAGVPVAVVDTAGVGAGNCFRPSLFFCPFIPTGLEGQIHFAYLVIPEVRLQTHDDD